VRSAPSLSLLGSKPTARMTSSERDASVFAAAVTTDSGRRIANLRLGSSQASRKKYSSRILCAPADRYMWTWPTRA